jgi:transcriptional regulator with XRE-family HTH domain
VEILLGEILKEQRKERGLTQQAVSDELHISRQTLSNWENEKNYPDIPMLIQLSDYYSLSLDYMLKGDPKYMDRIQKSIDNDKQISILKIHTIGVILISVLLGIIQQDIFTGLFAFAGTMFMLIIAKFLLYKSKLIQAATIFASAVIIGTFAFLSFKIIITAIILLVIIFVGEFLLVLNLEKKLEEVKDSITL